MTTVRTLTLILLLFASVARAQAPATFREGVLAFEKKEWARAEKLMRETIAGNPKESEGTVSIGGSWYETYVPHYFLARALAKQGKCAEALVAFAETERQGVTPNIGDFARHLNNRGGCKPQAKQEKPSRVVGEIEVPFEEAPVTPKAKPAPAPASVPGPVPAPAATATVAPAPDTRAFETRTRLTTAVGAYLRGEYELTARLLTGNQFADRAAAAEAALFRAAARHALYRIGGGKDEALRRGVEDDLRTYRALRPDGRPDPRVFPRGFVALAGNP